MVMRAYTPTSSDDDLGHFDLVVKVYFGKQHKEYPEVRTLLLAAWSLLRQAQCATALPACACSRGRRVTCHAAPRRAGA